MLKGFDSDVFDSQAVFRKLLTAVANPGTLMDINIDLTCPEGIHPASGGVLLTLMDSETPFWSDMEHASAGVQWLRFHTGAPYTRLKHHSSFALCTHCDHLEDPALFNPGTMESPDTATTLVIQTRGMDDTGRIRLTGPGLGKPKFLNLKGVKPDFLQNRSELCRSYPLGVDMIFICDRTLAALPRTTKAEVL
ncbi:MAG: phosphonate C-P lyase system protein PhnH [Desulfobacula sp.]|nr:phosphonate C-P lyase system protein PhnH [Desulfobacula sp.]